MTDDAVVIDLAGGRLTIGPVTVPCAPAGAGGALRIDGEGPILRPVTFGERSAVVARAARDGAQREALVAGLLTTALVETPGGGLGADAGILAEAVTLALAGGHTDAPPFETTRRLACARWGLSPRRVDETIAAEIDAMVRRLAPPGLDGEDATVRRFVLVERPGQSVEAIRTEMADRLLRRGVPASRRPAPAAPAGRAGADAFAALGETDARPGVADLAAAPPLDGGPGAARLAATRAGEVPLVPDRAAVADAAPAARAETQPTPGTPEPPTLEAPRPTITADGPRLDGATRGAASATAPTAARGRRATAVDRSPRRPARGAATPAATRRDTRGDAASTLTSETAMVSDTVVLSGEAPAVTIGAPLEPRVADRPAPGGAPRPSAPAPSRSADLADALAALLDAESELRGID